MLRYYQITTKKIALAMLVATFAFYFCTFQRGTSFVDLLCFFLSGQDSGLSDCFLHHFRSTGRFHFKSHTLKEFFPLKYIWDKQYCILFCNTVDPEQLVSDKAV